MCCHLKENALKTTQHHLNPFGFVQFLSHQLHHVRVDGVVRVQQVMWEGSHHPNSNCDAGASVWGRHLHRNNPEEKVQDQEVQPRASQQRREETAQGTTGKKEEQAGQT